jgi:nucleoside-diphosphate kinase
MLPKTLFLVKPDAVARGLTGKILADMEREGFRLERLELQRWDRAKAEAFYSVHRGKSYFDPLIEHTVSGPLVAAVLVGEDIVTRVRVLNGATDPAAAAPGTLRRKYGLTPNHNAVHGSDSLAAAAYEIAVVFGDR